MPHILITILFLFQSTPDASLRALFGHTLTEARMKLDEINTQWLRSRNMSPAQVQTALARLKFPAPNAAAKVVVLNAQNAGGGLIAMLSKEGVAVEQINLALCGATDRIIAAHILLNSALDPAAVQDRLRRIYSLPDAIPFEGHHPAIKYPLPGISYTGDGSWVAEPDARPLTVWRSQDLEAVFQPLPENVGLTGQLWITQPSIANACATAGVKK